MKTDQVNRKSYQAPNFFLILKTYRFLLSAEQFGNKFEWSRCTCRNLLLIFQCNYYLLQEVIYELIFE